MKESFPDEYNFCIVTGALTGPPKLVERLNAHVVLVVPSGDLEESSDSLDDDSAVGRAERLIQEASTEGNFEVLWRLSFNVFEAQCK